MMSSSSHNDIPDCQMPCDPDCEIAPVHCWNHHRPNHKPDWHDPIECDQREAANLTAEILADPEALAQIRLAQDEVVRGDVISGADAVRELTRLGEDLGDDDLSPEQVVAGCREARRQLAAEREQEG